MKDILIRLHESSPNESSHELYCRCLDAVAEIESLRLALHEALNAPYLAHAHCLCSDLGVPHSHINDRLLTAIQIYGRMKARSSQADKALEFAEYMAKSGEHLLNALNNQCVAENNHEEINSDATEAALDHALDVRGEGWTGLQGDIYEFRKRVPS